ncbi:MAG: hypothetical protein PVI82_15410, partial [Desulfobacterales bacterium]
FDRHRRWCSQSRGRPPSPGLCHRMLIFKGYGFRFRVSGVRSLLHAATAVPQAGVRQLAQS